MKSLYKLLIFLFIFLPSTITTIHANEIFKHLNIDNGLAHTDANCLAQDSTGLIWIGTFAGLQSYDGYTLETFDYYPQGHKVYESHNRIRAIVCNKNRMWLGTESGLTCFDLNTHRYIPYYIEDEKLSIQLRATVTDLFIAPDGCHLWIRTPQEIIAVQAQNDTLSPMKWDSEADRIFCKGISDIQFQGKTAWASSGWHIMRLSIENGRIALLNSHEAGKLFGKDQWIRSICLRDSFLYARSGDGCYRFSVANGQLITLPPPISTSIGYIRASLPSPTGSSLSARKAGCGAGIRQASLKCSNLSHPTPSYGNTCGTRKETISLPRK